MRYNTTKQKVLELFFDFPLARMHLREIARRIKISAPAVSRALVDLEKEEYIELEKRFLVYAKATNKNKFRNAKRIFNLEKIYRDGLLKRLEENCPLSTIILFGSYSRGEDTEKSDIDIAVLAAPMELGLQDFEGVYNRKINIQFFDSRNISEKIWESLINGIVLQGSLRTNGIQ